MLENTCHMSRIGSDDSSLSLGDAAICLLVGHCLHKIDNQWENEHEIYRPNCDSFKRARLRFLPSRSHCIMTGCLHVRQTSSHRGLYSANAISLKLYKSIWQKLMRTDTLAAGVRGLIFIWCCPIVCRHHSVADIPVRQSSVKYVDDAEITADVSANRIARVA